MILNKVRDSPSLKGDSDSLIKAYYQLVSGNPGDTGIVILADFEIINTSGSSTKTIAVKAGGDIQLATPGNKLLFPDGTSFSSGDSAYLQADASNYAALSNQLRTGDSTLQGELVVANTAANLASSNPMLFAGQNGYETDTLSFKIGDSSTAYNSLTYAYRGLPVAGEPSLGTPHQRVTNVLSVDPVDTNWHSIDIIAAGYPAGTKAVTINLAIRDVTNGRLLTVSNSSGGSVYAYATSEFNTADQWSNGLVPLDANGLIWYSVTNATVALATIDVTEYWE